MAAGEKRSFLDRMMSSTQPRGVEEYRPQPQPLAEGLWTIERKLKMPGGLKVLSPPKLASDLLRDKKAAEEYLRPVRKWSFRRIVVSHGIALENNAQAEFRRAFAKYRGATS